MLTQPFRFAVRLGLLAVALLVAGCGVSPSAKQGFDAAAFAMVSARATQARLRLPPGTDINGTLFLELVEGSLSEETAQKQVFELRRVDQPYTAQSGSTVLSFELLRKDFARYDRAKSELTKHLLQEQAAGIRVNYRICHRAGLPVGPPVIIGFVLISDNNIPIYLVELTPTREDVLQLPYCV